MKFVSIAAAALLLQAATAGQKPGSASIEGIVVKVGAADVQLLVPTAGKSTSSGAKPVRGSGEPLGDTTVELTIIAGERVRSTTVKTGSDGKFAFRNIPPGEGYQLIAINTPEYLPSQYGQHFPGLPGTPISLSAGQSLKEVRIVMARAASISGRVHASKTARPSGQVYVIRPFYVDGRRVLGSQFGKNGVVAMTATNNNGDYRVSGLLPGQYYVCAAISDQYCHTEKNEDEPSPVNLRVGENLTGLNVDLRSQELKVLHGEVINAVTGKPAVSARIGLVSANAVPNPPSTPLRVITPTPFNLNASPGSYFLVASTEEGGSSKFGYLPVKVRGSDLSRLRVVVSPPFDIPVQITGNISANGIVWLQPRIPGMPSEPIERILGDGGLTLRAVTPGEYRVDVVTPRASNVYMKSIKYGGKELLDGILRVETASNKTLEITLGLNAARVRGNVFGELITSEFHDPPAPLDGVRVVLVPDLAFRNRQDLFKDAVSDSYGEFRFDGVAPGSYKLFAWELVQPGAWHDPEFIRIYEDYGKPIRVAEGSLNILDINVVPGGN